MILATAALIFTGVSVAIVVRLRECHVPTDGIHQDLHAAYLAVAEEENEAPVVSQPLDVAFTESLLALSRGRLRAPDDSRVPEHDESSSLVSVRPHQSKTHVPVS